jgi:putative addiction module component (TIGR02574 family)
MSLPDDELWEHALALSEEARLQLAEALLASIGPPFDAEWLAEAKRRAARIDSGEGKLSSWAEVRDRARRAVGGQANG